MIISPSDTAFEGFRIIRDRPGLILAWTAFYLLSLLAMIVILLVPNFGNLAAVEATGTQRDFSELLARFGVSMFIAFPLAVIMPIMLVTAIYRTVLNPEDKGFAHLKISADELRMFLVSLLVIIIFAIASGIYGALVVLPNAPSTASTTRCEHSAAAPATGRGYSACRNVPRGGAMCSGAKQPAFIGTSGNTWRTPIIVAEAVQANGVFIGPRQAGLLREKSKRRSVSLTVRSRRTHSGSSITPSLSIGASKL